MKFDILLEKVSHFITEHVWHGSILRQRISRDERLIVTLQLLSQGMSFVALSFIYRHGAATIRNIVLEGTWAIRQALKNEYCSIPQNAGQ